LTRRIAVAMLVVGAAVLVTAAAARAQSKRVPYNIPFASAHYALPGRESARIKFLKRQVEGVAHQDLSRALHDLKATKSEITEPVVLSRRRRHEKVMMTIYVMPPGCAEWSEQIIGQYVPVKGGGERVSIVTSETGGGDFPCKR
jgi:hypothetical protein